MSSANNKGRMSRRKKMEPWYYVGPIFLLLVIMFGYPLIKSVVMAFQNYKLGNANVYFNDFANFHKMFGDKDFLLLLKNSVVYVVVSVFGQFIGGLILALCLRDKFKGRGIYQSIVFLPWAFSAFVVGLVFRWSFNGEYGVVNDVLMKLGIIKKGIAWLGTPGLSLVVVILAMIWIGIPFFGIMILAALQSIPDEIYEAADMDGATGFQKLFKITIPSIKNTIFITGLLRIIWVANSVDVIFNMTEGGPAYATQTLSVYVFNKAQALNLGYSSAMAILLALVLCLVAVPYLIFTFREEDK